MIDLEKIEKMVEDGDYDVVDLLSEILDEIKMLRLDTKNLMLAYDKLKKKKNKLLRAEKEETLRKLEVIKFGHHYGSYNEGWQPGRCNRERDDE